MVTCARVRLQTHKTNECKRDAFGDPEVIRFAVDKVGGETHPYGGSVVQPDPCSDKFSRFQ